MTKTASTRIVLLKKIALVPLFIGLIYFLSVETVAQQKKESTKTQTLQSNLSDDERKDAYYAGVRIKVYKKSRKTKTGVVGEGLIIDKLYEELTLEEKEKYKMFLYVPKTLVKKTPTQKEFEDYKNNKKYAIWIDFKNVPNSELNKYKPKDIAYFSGSSVLKNARTKEHPQPFQFWFFTHSHFDKTQMGKEEKKYGGDTMEIFENADSKKEKKQTIVKNVAVSDIHISDIHTTVEKKPTFQGGLEKFYEFIGQNFTVPEVKNLEGKVIVEFIVEKDGSLSEIKTIQDIGHGTGDEAVRVLKNSPKWNPGEQDGKPVRVLYTLPISIKTP